VGNLQEKAISDFVAVNPGDLPDVSQATLHGLLGIVAGEPADLAVPRLRRQIRGGLPPRALRRVREYVEAPPFSEVAIASGFADQSHFCRQFSKLVGTTPSTYRWSMR
jgi:AraC-like DNA-binding protein